MPDEPDLLVHVKPLADPVRVITILMVVGSVIAGVIASVLYAQQFGIYGVLLGLPMAGVGISYALLIGPIGKPNAIYLRAFRTDRSTAKLRAELAAVLGPGYRLSGIRTPQKKTSVFLRFLVPGLVALNYAGSKFMELEAGDDWMARLWKTYQTTRLVFIDVRDVTIHVHNEIQMTIATMGAERCISIVGPGKTIEEWRALIAAIVGPEYETAKFNLLDASDERMRSREMQADLKTIVAGLPPGVPGQTDRGRQFVLQHVPADLLKKSGQFSVMSVASAIAAVALSVGVSTFAGLHHRQPYLLTPLIILGMVVTVRAMLRSVGRIRRLARAGHSGAAWRVGMLLAVACLPFVVSVFSLAIAIPALERSKRAANEVGAMASLRAIETAEIMYATTYPEQGYACQLSQLGGNAQAGAPTAAAQLIQDDLAAGKKFGYTFAISKCSGAAGGGSQPATEFQVTAVPDDPIHTRGLCVDQSGEIMADPKGGTNCTVPME
jgi:type IV pilus assembly protein PilA